MTRLQEKLNSLPKKPGCYLMYNQAREIIYVGKAKNLFNRVKSYFTGVHDAKTTKLVENIADFEYIITSSEKEAFILEMNLIKKHNPKYNIMFTDDKKYPYIAIGSDQYPRLYYTRDIKKKGKYFGPYPHAAAAKEIVELLNRIYPLRKCRIIPKKECLYYHLGQCLAPCINEVSEEEYQMMLDEIAVFLNGNSKALEQKLDSKMRLAADNLQFEKALEYRQMLESLKTVAEKQVMEMRIKDTDVFSYHCDGQYVGIQVFHIRGEKTIGSDDYLFELMGEPEEIFINFIGQFYITHNNPLPREILLPPVDLSGLDEEIRNRIVIPKRGQKKKYVDLVTENAREKLAQLLKIRKKKLEKTLGAVNELSELLGIKPPLYIEAFDVSNIQGSYSVGAMVAYLDGAPSRKNYRKYRIKTVSGADDVHSMYEIVTRRYRRLRDEGARLPDLVIVDGGRPQVDSAERALTALELGIPVLGLGKDDRHRTSYLVFRGGEIHPDKKSNAFFFLENLQDEVHRFAITFYRQTHSRAVLASKLDAIKGIGKVRKKQILALLKEADRENLESRLKELHLTDEQIQEIKKVV